MTEERYESEVRPVVFKMLSALESYVTRIGIGPEEMDRAIAEWLYRRRWEKRLIEDEE